MPGQVYPISLTSRLFCQAEIGGFCTCSNQALIPEFAEFKSARI